ncbi:MAG: protein kinase, partial [Myxococcota bacterium]
MMKGTGSNAERLAREPSGSSSPDQDTMMRDSSSSGSAEWSDTGSREQTNPRVPREALPAEGEHIRHYELIRKLGEGGMGSVFLARDNKLGRRVAIKFLHTVKPELAERFIVEARTTAAVAHENIVIIYEADEHKGFPYMVL